MGFVQNSQSPSLAIQNGWCCKVMAVLALLDELTSLYPLATYNRADKGPEFIAHALRRWSKTSGTIMA
jgi:putative transposase